MKRRHLLLATTAAPALGGLSVPAWSQRGFDQPPEPGPAAAPPVPTVTSTALPNGLRLSVLEQPAAARVALRLRVPGGWWRETAGREGLAELCLSMLSQGARRGDEVMDSADLAFAGDQLGRPLRQFLSGGGAELALEALPDQADDAFNLLADLASAPTLTFEALEHQRERAQDALALLRAGAQDLAPWMARRQFWGKAVPVASRAGLQRLKRADVQDFHRQHWRPEKAHLVVCGPLGFAAARDLAMDCFADWRGAKGAAPAATAGSAATGAATAAPSASAWMLPLAGTLQNSSAGAATAAGSQSGSASGSAANLGGSGCRLLLQTALPRSAPPATRALARVLLLQRLAARQPWPWESEIEAGPGPASPAAWRLSLTLPAAAVAEQLAWLREQLPRLAAEPVTADDLALAQALALGEWQRALERTPDESLSAAIAAGELEDWVQWPQRLRGVSAPVLQLALGACWQEGRTHALLLGELAPGDALQRAWPGLAAATMRAVIGE